MEVSMRYQLDIGDLIMVTGFSRNEIDLYIKNRGFPLPLNNHEKGFNRMRLWRAKQVSSWLDIAKKIKPLSIGGVASKARVSKAVIEVVSAANPLPDTIKVDGIEAVWDEDTVAVWLQQNIELIKLTSRKMKKDALSGLR